jgi:hypothetical protein
MPEVPPPEAEETQQAEEPREQQALPVTAAHTLLGARHTATCHGVYAQATNVLVPC